MKFCPFNIMGEYTRCNNGVPFQSNAEKHSTDECMAWCSIPGYCKMVGRCE